LKSLKYDNDEKIDLSSYDLASIAYNIFPAWLTAPPGRDLLLVRNTRNYLRYLVSTPQYRTSIDVPNQMRKVFGAGGATETGLKQLTAAIDALATEIEVELSRSFRKLEEARVLY